MADYILFSTHQNHIHFTSSLLCITDSNLDKLHMYYIVLLVYSQFAVCSSSQTSAARQTNKRLQAE